MTSSADTIAVLLVGLKCLLFGLSVLYLISGIDDLFIDLCWLAVSLRRGAVRSARWLLRRPDPDALPSVEALLRNPEQPIAMMVPAWDESAVIRPMLTSLLQRIDYARLHVFVGTYPNDPKTQAEVDRVRARFPNVHRVVCAHNGPTNKADCLNNIYDAIGRFECDAGITFQVFVMNDAEDVVHPLYLKLFNALVPGADLVQIPVMPLPVPWRHFTAGHYLDEFAESHSKDVLVRAALTGVVPSAGVGTAFSRRAMAAMAQVHGDQLFSTASLTEDYDVSFRVREHGLRQRFVWYPIPAAAGRARDYIVIREHFPSTLRTAVRQKGRWIVGIALQGWESMGWRGDAPTKYLFFRDRKALVTSQLGPLGYLVVLGVTSVWLSNVLVPDSYHYPPLVEQGSTLWYLVLANAGFLTLRLIQRMLAVYRLHGAHQALLAAPRQVWGNIVNFLAGARALRLYARYRITGRSITWDKTAHIYPTDPTTQGKDPRGLGEAAAART